MAGRGLLWRVWLFSTRSQSLEVSTGRGRIDGSAHLFTLLADHFELGMSGIWRCREVTEGGEEAKKRRSEEGSGFN